MPFLSVLKDRFAKREKDPADQASERIRKQEKQTGRIDREIGGIERRQRDRKGQSTLGKINKGIDRAGDIYDAIGNFGGGVSKFRKEQSQGFGDMFSMPTFGEPEERRRERKPRSRDVPIYGSGGRVVGYRRTARSKPRKKRQQSSNPYEIDFGF